MARKICPECKLMTAGSAASCSRCGYAYPSQVVAVAAAPGVRRCLMCGLTNVATATRCECGADLEVDPAELRTLIAHRRSAGWSLLAGSIALGIISVIGSVAALVLVAAITAKATILVLLLAFSGVGAATAGCRKGMRILGATRAERDALDGKAGALPQARLRG